MMASTVEQVSVASAVVMGTSSLRHCITGILRGKDVQRLRQTGRPLADGQHFNAAMTGDVTARPTGVHKVRVLHEAGRLRTGRFAHVPGAHTGGLIAVTANVT